MKTELKQIIQELKEVIEEEGLQILDKDLLEFSIRILNTTSINNKPKFNNYLKNEFKNDFNKGKYLGKEIGGQSASPLTSKDEPPTKKQIDGCKRMGLTIPAGSTKKDVWKIMNENKENGNKN